MAAIIWAPIVMGGTKVAVHYINVYEVCAALGSGGHVVAEPGKVSRQD